MPFSEFRALCKFHGLIPGSTALTSINKITEMHPEELLQISKTPAGSSVHLLQTEGSGLVSARLSPQQEDSGKGKAPLPYHGKESQRAMTKFGGKSQRLLFVSENFFFTSLFPNLLHSWVSPSNKASKICPSPSPFFSIPSGRTQSSKFSCEFPPPSLSNLFNQVKSSQSELQGKIDQNVSHGFLQAGRSL